MSKGAQAAGANPRRTPLIGKRAIYGWKPVRASPLRKKLTPDI